MSGFISPLLRKSWSFTWWNAGGRRIFRPPSGARPTSLPDRETGRPAGAPPARAQRRLLDLHEELDVVACLLQLVQEQLEGLLRLQRTEHPAQLDDDGELVG